MKTLVEHIAMALVDHPDDVRVSEHDDGHSLHIELSVHPDDMGKVIGKQGRTAKALRSVVYAAATKQKRRVRLDIID
ncbi:KH domain-containing protein [Halalkalibacterium halodurans]|uniref:RNA-binding protein KhpA n=2 Tax=Halalkalibacterium halodurans TaxID=86665 RepID=KHPA_HALH5|nr:KH domain-containing protein [Halalkalibacterium halodurans]Q9KA12.1 RecName: Full=RNA-binding protein KhpA; AltName: Full=KH-domain protein A [Halalkalibacterium halodurans C-125]MDY7223028.1 KH domain-containing protein [Halalkalibacterium halodurans]MDY7242249.1 KH domain-containing protein [Halalkalibacterium halodurans]MED3646697.1 KH domain-containing protein [Halalkalibacterium halodurans]MED4081523.1 KH domain-containing protein [Halalkalibacterium halodurans]MED4086139.1 KH domain